MFDLTLGLTSGEVRLAVGTTRGVETVGSRYTIYVLLKAAASYDERAQLNMMPA